MQERGGSRLRVGDGLLTRPLTIWARERWMAGERRWMDGDREGEGKKMDVLRGNNGGHEAR